MSKIGKKQKKMELTKLEKDQSLEVELLVLKELILLFLRIRLILD